MTHYLISYDLKKAKNYPPLWGLLERSGAVRLLESLWVVSLTADAGPIHRDLAAAVDNDDAIVVIELKPGSQWAATNANSGGTAWMNAKIRRY